MKLCSGIFLLAATLALAQTNDLTALLQRGLIEEQANRNLDAAIADYRSLALQFDQDRQLAATAVFRLGECYRAQGRTNEAAAQYQRVLRDFSEQQTLAALSRQDLTGMGMAGSETAAAGKAGAESSRNVQGSQNSQYQVDATAEDESREILRVRILIQNSPDLINAPSHGTTPLITAAANGWLKVAAYLLDHGADVNISPPGGFGRATPLLAAVNAGNKAMTTFLIDRGADLKFRDGNGDTALHLAAQKGFQAVVEVLLASHAGVNAQDNAGATPLFSAVQGGQLKIIQMLLAANANVNLKDNEGRTVLNHAIGTSPEVIQVLLAAGANPNTEDTDGRAPLSYAAQRDGPEVLKLLLAAKADPNLGKLDAPLLCAIHEKNAASAGALLENGANPNTPGTVDWRPHSSNFQYYGNLGRALASPLWLAVDMDQLPMVQLLLKFKADPNESQVDGQPVLFRALTDTNILAALLAAGGKAGARQANGWTLLDGAVSEHNLAAAQLLLKFKADPNDSQFQGQSILFSVLMETNLLEALLDAGAKVDPLTQDANNWTPLDAAARDNNAAAVEILLKHGANPNVRNASGLTPLHCAARGPAGRQVFELLLAAKADPNVRNSDGETPLDALKKATAQNNSAPGPGIPMRRRPGSPPGYPPGNPGETAEAKPTQAAGELADLLRQHGALDKLPDWDGITVSRPAANFSFPIFRQGTNDWNQFTLLEAIANMFFSSQNYSFPAGNNVWSGAPLNSMLPFPDLAHVVIVRRSHGSTNETRQTVNLLNSTNGIDLAKDLPLEFGDEVEVPERDHALGENAVGLTSGQRATLADYVKGSVQLVAHGQNVALSFYRLDGKAILDVLLSKPEAQQLLLASSDLSRVKVTRHDPRSGLERQWILNCLPPSSSPAGAPNLPYQWNIGANNVPASPGLWLRNGDVIEVPEKP
jgi:ankyrin repeat protein